MNKKTKIILYTVLGIIILAFYYVLAALITTIIKEAPNFQVGQIFKYFTDGLTIGLTLIAFLVTATYFVYVQIKKGNKQKPDAKRTDSDLYDDSAFLTPKELDQYYGIQIGKNKFSPIFYNNLTSANVNGLIINSNFTKKNEFYFHAANELHSLVVGTTGTGKTKFLLIPSILMMAKSHNKPSLVIIDVKGEILSKTYHTVTSNNYDTHIIDLRHVERSEHYNPLDNIINHYDNYLNDKKPSNPSKFLYESEINKLANLIIPLEKGDDSFWYEAAQNIFKGIIYGLLEDYEDNLSKNDEKGFKRSQFTFASIYNINSLTPEEFREFFLRRNNKSESRKLVNTNVLSNYEPTGQMNRTLSSIMSTYVTAFNRFIDSASLQVTLKSDFSIDTIKEIPTAIYILLPDEDKSRYPLASIIINQIYSKCVDLSTDNMNSPSNKDVHFLLDEFANLPKLPNVDTWLSIGRERKIFLSIFVQAMSQLEDKYGKEYTKTIIQNCNLKVILGLGETQSVDYFKHMFGTYTVISSSASEGFKEQSTSTSSSLQKADLISSSRLMKMKPGEIYFIETKHNPGHTEIKPIFDDRFKILMPIKEYDHTSSPLTNLDEVDEFIYDPYDSNLVSEMIETATETLEETATPVEDSNPLKNLGINLDSDDDIGF